MHSEGSRAKKTGSAHGAGRWRRRELNPRKVAAADAPMPLTFLPLALRGGYGMQYVLLTYNAPESYEIWAAMTESERRAEEDQYVRLVEAMHESKAYIAANELEPSTSVHTVRVRNGMRSVTDGPVVQ